MELIRFEDAIFINLQLNCMTTHLNKESCHVVLQSKVLDVNLC